MNVVYVKKMLSLNSIEKKLLNTITSNFLFNRGDKKTIAVTSCQFGEGKSYMSLRISDALVKEGYRVVIVEADSRGSSRFENKEEKSNPYRTIADYFSEKCNFFDVLLSTDIDDLYILPYAAVDSKENISICTKQFSQFVKLLSEKFDFVIVDAVAANDSIDAARIASVCDGVILIAEYNKCKKSDMKETIKQLQKANCLILGCVINKVTFKKAQARKFYHQYYQPFFKRFLKKN